jgi:uncharacterized membrane protein
MNLIKNEDQLGIVKASMWLGYLVMLGMGAVLVIWEPADGNVSMALLFCVVIFTANFFAYIGIQQPSKDERARRIGTMAATSSWFITLVLMCFVYIWAVTLNFPLSMARFLGILLIIMIVSMATLNFSFGRKGDVD